MGDAVRRCSFARIGHSRRVLCTTPLTCIGIGMRMRVSMLMKVRGVHASSHPHALTASLFISSSLDICVMWLSPSIFCLRSLPLKLHFCHPLPHQLLPSPLDIRIKWPNDIYTSSGLKIGGILIHTTWASDRFNVVTGVGLNVHNRNPTTCIEEMLQAACSSSSISSSHDRRASGMGGAAVAAAEEGGLPQVLDRELLLARIVTRLEECFQVSLA